MTRIALLGLGRMGLPMARHLNDAGFDLRSWNRSPSDHQGVRLVADPMTAVDGAEIIILMLSDGAAVEDVLFGRGLAGHLARGALVVDMGTTGPRAARDHAVRLAQHGIRYLDAPVSGGVLGAEQASLTILVGGDPADFDRARPMLECLGTPHHLGAIGAGQTAKLANQLIVANYIAAVAEAIRFAESEGLEAAALVRALRGGFADSAILRQHGVRMAERNFAPGGTCLLHLKDLDLAAALMDDFPKLQNSDAVRARFQALVATGHGQLDHSALYLSYAPTE